MIFVSKRNVDKQFITLSNFVPVYMQEDKLMYCGDEKPSVDTPVQVRLYEKLNKVQKLQSMFEAVWGFEFYRKYGKMVRTAVSGILIPTDDRKRK